jgi:hypothetical protein
MMDVERPGPRASAWADACSVDSQAVFNHILGLEIALRAALKMLRSSAYALHMKDTLDEWQALLEAVPPDK